MKIHTSILLALATACVLFAVTSCATVYRAVGISPASDLDDHRAEEQKALRDVTDVLSDAIDGRIPPYEIRSRVAAVLKQQEDDWSRREPPAPFPWLEVITLILGGGASTPAIGVKMLNDHRNRTRARELAKRDESIEATDKWVEEVEEKSNRGSA